MVEDYQDYFCALAYAFSIETIYGAPQLEQHKLGCNGGRHRTNTEEHL